MNSVHIPVLPNEVIDWLQPKPSGIYLDGTYGGGGHSRLIAERLGGDGTVVGLDWDEEATEASRQTENPSVIRTFHAGYHEAPQVLAEAGIGKVDGILLDLGLSSDQLASTDRGFSFATDGELDLRFDRTQGEPAWRLLNRLSERHLADMIFEYGEDRLSRQIARAIVDARRETKIVRSAQLAEIVRQAVRRTKRKQGRTSERIDEATRTFQALRIAVNDELGNLKTALRHLPDLLKEGGRMLIISFHSLEDRMVKQAFRDDPRLSVLTRKPVRPDDTELATNPRSRSSRLRVAERQSSTS